jgi:hypothetical protein
MHWVSEILKKHHTCSGCSWLRFAFPQTYPRGGKSQSNRPCTNMHDGLDNLNVVGAGHMLIKGSLVIHGSFEHVCRSQPIYASTQSRVRNQLLQAPQAP